VLAPRQGLLKGRDRLYAARAFSEALQLQKDRKVPLRAGLDAAISHAQIAAVINCVHAHHEPSLPLVMSRLHSYSVQRNFCTHSRHKWGCTTFFSLLAQC
jgi:hypothetical protein